MQINNPEWIPLISHLTLRPTVWKKKKKWEPAAFCAMNGEIFAHTTISLLGTVGAPLKVPSFQLEIKVY